MLTYFQEKLDAGVFDQRDPAHIWKYFINTRSGKEVAFDISKDPHESVDRLATAPPRFVSEWRAKVLPTYGTGVFVGF